MTRQRSVVLAALAGGALLGGLGLGTLLRPPPPDASDSAVSEEPEAASASGDIGGEFELVNQNGERIRLSDLRGKALLLFFGYTHCPDVCPATLANMRQVKENLGADAARFQGVFITVDPARDTPDRLRDYVGYFDPSFVALTGTEDEIAAVTKQFGAAYQVDERLADGGYLMGHTAFGYLIAPSGKVRTLFPSGATWQEMLEGVRSLLNE